MSVSLLEQPRKLIVVIYVDGFGCIPYMSAFAT
jgi:hypothetical protein